MSDKVLVDKKDIVDIANVAQRLNYDSYFYYRRFNNWYAQGVFNSDYLVDAWSSGGVGRPYSNVLTSNTGYKNAWITKTITGASRICADVYYGLNTKATAICVVKQGGAPASAPSAYNSDYTTINGYITHFSMLDTSSNVEKMQRMLRTHMYCTNVPQANQKHFEVEGDTISLGFNIATSSSYYSPPTGYSYKQYGIFIVFYDPDSIRQVEDTSSSTDTLYNMGGTDRFYNTGYEEEWSDIKNALLNYMPASTYLDIKSNGTFYGNNGYITVDVPTSLIISKMGAVEITATDTSSGYKKRTYDLSSYLTKSNQIFFLRLYVSNASSSSGSSTGYVEWLFSPLFTRFDPTNTSDVTMLSSGSTSAGSVWLKKSTGTTTYSSKASPSISTTSQIYQVATQPWNNCTWSWSWDTKQLYIQNTGTSYYYPSSPKAILYYIKA